jgi:hypothetical protein
MARLISQKGQTANVTIGSPQQGMKWIIKWAVVILHTGTGTGSRNVTLAINRGNTGALGQENPGPVIANTGTQTGTSTTYSGIGDVSPQGFYSGQLIQFSQFPEVYAIDVIQSFVSLVSGDTYDYYILIEEASS